MLLKNISLARRTSIVGRNAFNGCSNLTKLELTDRITSLGSRFISGTQISTITIPALVIDFGFQAWSGDNPGWAERSDAAFNGSIVQNIVFADGRDTIQNYALYECERVRKISMPDSMTEIGSWAFLNCKNILEITVSGSIGASNFRDYCDSLLIVSINEGATTIGYSAFLNLKTLKEVYIPDSVTSIANNAFDGCSPWLTIYGSRGTYTHEYTLSKGIAFSVAKK
ncbi:hypothetical protein AGMMS49992_15230 [Clostridia bacterium]|nr:hypothetical protein AGMMS49992_15230 [Clostridia bacterium]